MIFIMEVLAKQWVLVSVFFVGIFCFIVSYLFFKKEEDKIRKKMILDLKNMDKCIDIVAICRESAGALTNSFVFQIMVFSGFWSAICFVMILIAFCLS